MSNDYIKNAISIRSLLFTKPFLEEAGRLTDKAEKLVELYKTTNDSTEEIVPLQSLLLKISQN